MGIFVRAALVWAARFRIIWCNTKVFFQPVAAGERAAVVERDREAAVFVE